ncbi:MAG: Holliday junction branch migration protein RuvA [Patescibacteria group bacterium]
MLYGIQGTLRAKRENFIVVETGGISFRVAISAHTLANLPETGSEVKLFTHLHVREDALQLFGFQTELELKFFEQLNSVSGVGPKSALGVMSIANTEQLIAAINDGHTELITRASGIGKKTAERIVLELKGKMNWGKSQDLVTLMESDVELEETLVSLGYSRTDAKQALQGVPKEVQGFKARLREALKNTKR